MEKENYPLNDLIAESNALETLISEKTHHLTFQDYCEKGNREIIKIQKNLIKALQKIIIFEKENLGYGVFLKMPYKVVLNIEKEFP